MNVAYKSLKKNLVKLTNIIFLALIVEMDGNLNCLSRSEIIIINIDLKLDFMRQNVYLTKS